VAQLGKGLGQAPGGIGNEDQAYDGRSNAQHGHPLFGGPGGDLLRTHQALSARSGHHDYR
jgi:hypothetical protein